MAAATLAAPSALAQTYVSGSLAFSPDTDIDYVENIGVSQPAPNRTTTFAENGLGGSLALGRQFGDWRAEIEWAYDHWIDAQSYSVMTGGDGLIIGSLNLNGYYDLPISGQLRPYIGAGVGYASADFADGVTNASAKEGLRVQVMGGITADVDGPLAAFAELRWHTEQVATADDFPNRNHVIDGDTDVNAYGVHAGLRWSF
jgi:opacity protein-like surface antigen